MNKKLVAIVGRPNVGKSTLFNRLTGSREAIVDAMSGVTRDRHYGDVDWTGKEFGLVDTGGFDSGKEDPYQVEIKKQVDSAIQEADLILFVLDVKTGITDLDDELADVLRKAEVPVLIVANKADDPTGEIQASEMHALGMGEVFPISSANGSGTGDLLDEVVSRLELQQEEEEEEDEIPRFAVVGKPNVGKSSLVNTLTGEYRSVVTDEAGTTRDSTDTRYKGYGFDFILVDTAGIRKKNKVREDVEYYANLRAIRSIEKSDVCLLLIDANEGIQRQDLNIITMVEKNRKGLVVLVNKWDTIKDKDGDTAKEYERIIRGRIPQLKDVPIIFTSVTEKQRVFKALERAVEVHEERSKRIPTRKLNDVMLKEIEKNPPPAIKGKYIRIKYIHQIPGQAPAFSFFCNYPKLIKPPYRRYLENKIREHFGFKGVPLRLYFKQK